MYQQEYRVHPLGCDGSFGRERTRLDTDVMTPTHCTPVAYSQPADEHVSGNFPVAAVQ